MTIRLSKAFGSTPEFWLRLQLGYDLAQVKARADEIKVERYRPKDTDIPEEESAPVYSA